MTKLLPLILWTDSGAPEFTMENKVFTDGTCIEMASKAAEFISENQASLKDTYFIIRLLQEDQELAQHRFQVAEFKSGNNFWLIADPQKTNPNESFTGVFIEALLQLPEGQTPLKIQVSAEHKGELSLLEEGALTFDTHKGKAYYTELLTLLQDPEKTRQNESEEFLKKQEAEREQQAAERASKHYKIKLKNSQNSLTTYVIYKDMRSLSEFITSVQPGATTEIKLNLGLSYDILSYLQNTPKEQARKISTVTKSQDGLELVV